MEDLFSRIDKATERWWMPVWLISLLLDCKLLITVLRETQTEREALLQKNTAIAVEAMNEAGALRETNNKLADELESLQQKLKNIKAVLQ